MNTTTDPLQSLRPLHLPDPISWWPPAPGWWLVALLVILLIFLIAYWWRRNIVRRAALRELRQLQRGVRDPQQRLSSLALLLRRYAIASHPDKGVAGLAGEAWLEFLDNHGGGGEFKRGAGRCLLDAPFKSDGNIDDTGLQTLVARWIRENKVAR
ncbi:MAG: DUF4381 domain-containing protein [Sedimenticola sp.]